MKFVISRFKLSQLSESFLELNITCLRRQGSMVLKYGGP